MFIVIVISIIATGAVIVGALYSSIVPFFGILGNTANYNTAYYGAIGSAERALLSLRYHEAGYQGRGGFSGTAAVSGVITDVIGSGFGILIRGNSTMKWQITSLTNGIIPIGSGGDVERLLQGTGSKEFNMLGYDSVIELPLYIDDALSVSERYVSGDVTSVTAPNGIYIAGTLRLPPKVLGLFGGGGIYKLDTSEDVDSDNINDDIIANWSLKGFNLDENQGFSVVPTIKVDYNQGLPIYDFENAIRESHINDASNANGSNNVNIYLGEPGGDYEYNVITQPTITSSSMTGHNSIPANDAVLDPYVGFSDLLNNTIMNNMVLSLNLVNKMGSSINQVYPFLEYQIKVCEVGGACNVPVSNRYFSIDGSSKVGEYDVHIKINKPVLERDNTSEFAIIF